MCVCVCVCGCVYVCERERVCVCEVAPSRGRRFRGAAHTGLRVRSSPRQSPPLCSRARRATALLAPPATPAHHTVPISRQRQQRGHLVSRRPSCASATEPSSGFSRTTSDSCAPHRSDLPSADLIAASICYQYLVGTSTRPIRTRCFSQ